MIPGSVTVAYDGPGHVTYLSGKKCPIRHATTYLTDLTLPKPGTTCPAEESPAEHGGVGTNKRAEAITPAW